MARHRINLPQTGKRYTSFDALPSGAYDLIFSDPPWMYDNVESGVNQTYVNCAGRHYKLMKTEEMLQWDVLRLYRDPKRAVMLMWATCPKLDEALRLLQGWGFTYRGMPWYWEKLNQDGTPMKAKGVRPAFVKPLIEVVLVGSTMPKGRPLPIFTEKQLQKVSALRRAHSEKPDEVMRNVDELFGPQPKKLEMFARRLWPGWDAMGNEL